jgi:putative molybdopterin biosynthesis protein
VIPLPEARRRWREACEAAVRPAAVEQVAPADSLDRRLARPVIARRASPATRCAAMDGIAVRAADTVGAPVVLGPGSFEPVDTGAPVGDGWDAVVVREQIVLRPDGSADVLVAVTAGDDVRPPGEDIGAGSELFGAGTRMGPVEIAAAVAAGVDLVTLVLRPRVGIVPTGDEVVAADGVVPDGAVIDSNSPMLAALVVLAGAEPVTVPIVPDAPNRLLAALTDAAACDLVLVVAGSAGGRRDHTAEVLAVAGEVLVRGVAMRPGHPVVLGTARGTPAIGLPGYPIAAMAAFHAFAAPEIARLRGVPLPSVEARLADRIAARTVTRLVPVRIDGGIAHPLPGKAGAIRAALGADGMLEVEPGRDLVAGDRVTVHPFRLPVGE